MKRKVLALSLAFAFGIPAAHAVQVGDNLTISGFGTLGLTHSSNKDADYVSSFYFQPDGAGHTNSSTASVDSKAAFQFDYAATSNVRLVAQVLSKQREDDRWTPQMEWAYVSVKATPDLQVRLGRIRPAIYMASDYLDTNFANPWVRPPIEFYASAPVSNIDGVDLLWRPSTGDISWLVQPYFGWSDPKLTQSTESKVRNLVGVNVTANKGDFTGRIGYVQADMTVSSAAMGTYFGMLDGLCASGDPAACTQSSALKPDGKRGSFVSIGGNWDNGDYFVSGEWGRRRTDFLLSDGTAWYVTGGTRIGKWTPYATYSSFKNDGPLNFTGGTTNTNNVVTGLLQTNQMDQSSISLGVRYDLSRNFAVKGQYDRVKTQCRDGVAGTCKGLFINTQNGFENSSQSVNVLSINLDYSF